MLAGGRAAAAAAAAAPRARRDVGRARSRSASPHPVRHPDPVYALVEALAEAPEAARYLVARNAEAAPHPHPATLAMERAEAALEAAEAKEASATLFAQRAQAQLDRARRTVESARNLRNEAHDRVMGLAVPPLGEAEPEQEHPALAALRGDLVMRPMRSRRGGVSTRMLWAWRDGCWRRRACLRPQARRRRRQAASRLRHLCMSGRGVRRQGSARPLRGLPSGPAQQVGPAVGRGGGRGTRPSPTGRLKPPCMLSGTRGTASPVGRGSRGHG